MKSSNWNLLSFGVGLTFTLCHCWTADFKALHNRSSQAAGILCVKSNWKLFYRFLGCSKRQSKDVHVQEMKAREVMDIWSRSFLTSDLGAGELPHSSRWPLCPLEKCPLCTFIKTLCWSQRRSWRFEGQKICCPCRQSNYDSAVGQPVT